MADTIDKEQLSIVGSLFGMNPQQLQMAREQQAYTQGTQAGQNLLGGILGQTGMFTERAGAGLRSSLGVQTPEEQIAALRQEAQQQFDTRTPEGLIQLAKYLNSKGDTTGAQQAVMLAQQRASTAQKIATDRATEQAKLREPLPNIAKLQAYRVKMVEAGASPQQLAEIDAVIKAEGEGKGTKIIMPGEQQGKELRTANVKQYVDLGERALSAGSTLQTVNDMNSLINKAFTGVGAGAKLNVSQVANALGVNVTGTTESEQLDQLFSALTIGQAKNLKGALSDKDVKFLKEAVGSRGLTKDTLAAVVNRISRDAQVDDLTYQKATEYKSSGGDLADFDFVKAKKEAMADINEKAAKQRRLEELRRKANQ